MANVDILIKIFYDFNNPIDSTIKTKIRQEKLKNILEDYLSDQVGKRRDNRKMSEKEICEIEIGVDLSTGTFYTSSDTNNDGLTCGIIIHILKIFDKLKVLPL